MAKQIQPAAAKPWASDTSHSKQVPGTVIDHSAASTWVYIGSPSLTVLPNGEYLACHDTFGPHSTPTDTFLFASRDGGHTWEPRAQVHGQYWSTLFLHRGDLYLIGPNHEYGFVVIRRSKDGGWTWTDAVDRRTGLLLADGKYHCAPVPVVVSRGRIWRAMEDAMGPGGWGLHFRSFMLSAPEDADLLDADVWIRSNRIGRNPAWLNGTFGGWLEGNAVVDTTGAIVNILRVEAPSYEERAAIVHISEDGRSASFDPEHDFIELPGGSKKFTIRRDPRTGHYWTLANYASHTDRRYKPATVRNTLALMTSTDLRRWEPRAVLLRHPDPVRHGFQYVDWLFDGPDIIAAVRTAYDDGLGGAHNQHDANYLTFHRFCGFRSLQTSIP